MTKVRGVLKRSCQGLLNGDRQKIPNGLIDCEIKAIAVHTKVHKTELLHT